MSVYGSCTAAADREATVPLRRSSECMAAASYVKVCYIFRVGMSMCSLTQILK